MNGYRFILSLLHSSFLMQQNDFIKVGCVFLCFINPYSVEILCVRVNILPKRNPIIFSCFPLKLYILLSYWSFKFKVFFIYTAHFKKGFGFDIHIVTYFLRLKKSSWSVFFLIFTENLTIVRSCCHNCFSINRQPIKNKKTNNNQKNKYCPVQLLTIIDVDLNSTHIRTLFLINYSYKSTQFDFWRKFENVQNLSVHVVKNCDCTWIIHISC